MNDKQEKATSDSSTEEIQQKAREIDQMSDGEVKATTPQSVDPGPEPQVKPT